MQDPLSVNIPLAGIDTTLPLFPETDYPLQCAESKIVPNKDTDGLNWHLVFKTTQEYTSMDQRPIKAGIPFDLYIPLQPSKPTEKNPNPDPAQFVARIARTVDAIFGTSLENRPAFGAELVASCVGRTVKGTLKTEEYQGVKRSKLQGIKKLEG